MEKNMKRPEEGVEESSRSKFLDAVETSTELLRHLQKEKPMNRAFIIIAQDTSTDGSEMVITPLHVQGNASQLMDLILHLNLRKESDFLCKAGSIILDHKEEKAQEEIIRKGLKFAKFAEKLAAKLDKKEEKDDKNEECCGCGREEDPVCGDCGCRPGDGMDADGATATAQADLCADTAPYLEDAGKE